MQIPTLPAFISPLFAQVTSFILTLGLEFGLWQIAGGGQRPSADQTVFWILAVLFAILNSFIARTWIRTILSRKVFEAYVEENRLQRDSLTKRLDSVIHMNKLLADGQSEKELIDSSLAVITKATGAVGTSYIPFDEWGVALTPSTYGSFPEQINHAWIEHLSQSAVRQNCQTCTKLEADGKEPCPILIAPFADDSIHIHCLPFHSDNKTIGMLSLYLPANVILTGDLHEFAMVLLREMGLAIEMHHLRNMELATLRQIQMVAGQNDDLMENVLSLIQGLREVLDFDGARIDIKGSEPRFPGLHLIYGARQWLESQAAQDLLVKMTEGAPAKEDDMLLEPYIADTGAVLGMPLRLMDGTVIGAFILTVDPETIFQRQHLSLIETVAAETALLVENKRVQLDGQIRVIMQERTRLAREIHDSLAQTLAYLKLTASQMMSQLAHGDLSRLEQTLNQSYQALSEAYLETREVIDNLRMTPQESMADLLKQIAEDFEKSSGLPVETAFPANIPEIIPEVQAQLFRVVQEALSNIRKHANAHHVKLSMSIWNRQLMVEIRDDGVGFDSEDVPGLSQHGLQGMRERAELIGADFQIISKAGKGTTIRVQLPLKIEENLA